MLHANASSRDCIDHALEVFQTKDCYEPEAMRATFIKSRLLAAMGRTDESDSLKQKAYKMYSSRRHERGEDIPGRELSQLDFDEMVTFWSR